MKKLIFILALTLILSGCGSESATTIASDFTYNIKGCDNQNEEDTIILTPSENSLAFSQVLPTYCETEYHLTLEYNLSGNNIEIREVRDSSPITKCLCSLQIDGEIKNLASGEYQVKFVFDNQYNSRTETLEELTAVIE